MDADVERYLGELVERARAVLGERFAGAYAAGSVAMDAYLPGRSDVDVALLCTEPLDRATKRGIVERLRHEALPCPARGLELVVYRAGVARSGTAAPGFEVELNSGPRMEFRATYDPAERPPADGLFWYGLDRSILHARGRALAGLPAAEAFADLAEPDVRRLLADALRWWLGTSAAAPEAAGDDAVLGACRSLARARHGVWLSKAEAGRRIAAEGDPQRELIERSLAARTGGPPPDPAEAREFQLRALTELG